MTVSKTAGLSSNLSTPAKNGEFSSFFLYLGGNIKKVSKSYLILIIIVIVFCFIYIPLDNSQNSNIEILNFTVNQNGLIWPLPGYTTLSSYFGKRTAPTTGASSYHSGIDIPAPEGTSFVAVHDGTIIFTGFLGAGGYTITLEYENIRWSYCHASPNFIVKKGDTIVQGQVIGKVGPKYVDVVGNQYFDSQGRGTNGATTGPHLHFGMRIDGNYTDPLNYL